MSEIKHTPGPWTLESRGWDNQLVYGQDDRVPGDRRFIADVSLMFDGAEANARLIAAAPELLEALALVRAHLAEPECAIWRHVHAVMDAAIAKATGAES